MTDIPFTQGALIISNMLQLGHARVGDFVAAYGISTKRTKAATNGKSVTPAIETGPPISSIETLKSVMADMLKERFLVQVQAHHMHIRTDTKNALRAQLTLQLRNGVTSEIKLGKEVDRQLQIKLAGMADGDTSPHAGMKRKVAPTAKARSKKRQKISIYDNQDEEEEWEIDVSPIAAIGLLFRGLILPRSLGLS